jgi:hypothetical protein
LDPDVTPNPLPPGPDTLGVRVRVGVRVTVARGADDEPSDVWLESIEAGMKFVGVAMTVAVASETMNARTSARPKILATRGSIRVDMAAPVHPG